MFMNYHFGLPAITATWWLLFAQSLIGQVLLHDDLETGAGIWSTYPGSPACTPLSYVTTATEPGANHTPGGKGGFQMTRSSDRVFRDLDSSVYGSAGLHLSCWYYDALNLAASDFESFDIRDEGSSQILGFATRGNFYSASTFYWCRVLDLTSSDLPGGGYKVTGVQRTLGWHHLEIFQYRDTERVNTAEFYIDDTLALRQTEVVDITLTRVVLGLGWEGNSSQTGFVDDITVSVVPEPSSFSIISSGVLVLGALGLKRVRKCEAAKGNSTIC